MVWIEVINMYGPPRPVRDARQVVTVSVVACVAIGVTDIRRRKIRRAVDLAADGPSEKTR